MALRGPVIDSAARAAFRADYRKVFLETEGGRRVLAHLLMACGFFNPDLESARDVHQRNVVALILSMCGVSVDYPMMVKFVSALRPIVEAHQEQVLQEQRKEEEGQ